MIPGESHMKSRFLYFLPVFSLICQLSANPVISEFMADNETTLADEDGEFSDWIEIHNPTSAPISLLDWALTDKSSELTKWRFPNVSIQPGEFLIVWASSEDRRVAGAPLHTNFSLSKDGEYLALVRPDGVTVQQEFSPGFPAQETDASHGSRFQSTQLLAAGASGRYVVPTTASNPANTWNQPAFNDSSWASGPSGYGFGVNIPGMTVRQVSKNGWIEGLNDALNLIALPENNPLVLKSTASVMGTLNLLGDGADGHYGFNAVPPGGGGDNYVIVATGTLVIPAAGAYTFGINSDDGGQILINSTEVVRDDSFHGPQDGLGTITLSAGTHTFRVVMFEGGVGDCVEFFAAPGTRTAFDAGLFKLVGDVTNGGLAVSTTPQGGGGVVATNLQAAMAGRSSAYVRQAFASTGAGSASAFSLIMRYNDGFTAWLNGTKVAASNAPSSPAWNSVATAARPAGETLRRRGFNLAPALSSLTNGTNVLAIQGLNVSTADSSFLILPELVVGSLDTAAAPATYGNGLATPGWINGEPSSLGNVADTKFSIDRGFYSAPITVAITTATPGAVIRYTTDGSTPSSTHGTIYSSPLNISATTVLRAVATLDGWTSSGVDTQTYLFANDILTQSANSSPPPAWPSDSGTTQVLDYGMDPQIVNHTNPDLGGAAAVKSALLSLPSICLTTDLPNLFNINGSQGIYSNPYQRGFAWERPVSVEWINPPDGTKPNGSGEFQIDAGLRIRGGYSRSTDNPKHALRLFFRSEYGSAKLNYPIFGKQAARGFDKIDLRTAQNYSWSFEGGDQNTFLREESSRQAFLDMGQPGSHVQYFHLYLNGQYWGLHNFDERTEAAFSETYLGGKKEDYDVVKCENDTDYTVGATDGDLAAWQDLWNKGKTHRSAPTNANYFLMQGLSADGVTPSADPVLLDPDNLIDYLLVTFWTGNFDGCVSAFLSNERANNWFGSRMRVNNPRQGFRFFVHDFEHSLFNVDEDRTGPFTSAGEAIFAYSNPLFLHQDLAANAEYRMRWADRVHKHLFNDGALTPAAWNNRINRFGAIVDQAIIAESARWGDTKLAEPRTRNDWLNAQNSLLAYLTPRHPVVLAQLRADGLYPTLDAPVLTPYGGYQPAGREIAVSAPPGASIHYMPDGSDPRAVGGGLKPGALAYSSTTSTATLVPWSATGWKYLGTGQNLGDAWRAKAYGDSSWPSGTAELGYGDGDEATVIPIVDINPSEPGTQRPATYYFRRYFNASDVASITSLSLNVEFDDAYIIYINGSRVAGNLPENVSYSYYTNNYIEDTIETVSIPPSVLVNGSNTVAIEIHQAYHDSSDLSMNFSLLATRSTSATPVVLSGAGPRTLRFRARNGTQWSALSESTYQVGTVAPTQANLIVSEISYAPQAPHQDAEFIELTNPGNDPLDLGGAAFTEGIEFTFPAGTTLSAGGRTLIVKDVAAFEALHGSGKPIAGIFAFDTGLSNSGERLVLESATGTILADFSYGVSFPWPESANGSGRSMVLVNPADRNNPASWRPSAALQGNPGMTDFIPRAPGQGLLDYALLGIPPGYDPQTRLFSATRRLGADSARLEPAWSANLIDWFTSGVTAVSETPGAGGESVLRWKLDPHPPEKAFFRIDVREGP
jgi:CotH kinase protein/Lamin Tail Domain/Chitobiase/beta-hexosaminidase C-terminal domain/PA14 domain